MDFTNKKNSDRVSPPKNNPNSVKVHAGQAENDDTTQTATPIPDLEAADREAVDHNTQTTSNSSAVAAEHLATGIGTQPALAQPATDHTTTDVEAQISIPTRRTRLPSQARFSMPTVSDDTIASIQQRAIYCSLVLVILGFTAAGQALSGAAGAAVLEADGYSSYNSTSAAEANVVGGFILLLPYLCLAARDNENSHSPIYHIIRASLFSTAAGAVGGAVLDTGMSPGQHAAAGAVGAAVITSAASLLAQGLKCVIELTRNNGPHQRF